MEMKVHFIMHEDFEVPGAYADWAADRGFETAYTRSYINEAVPESAASIDLLIVMGGPQSPSTTKAECPHFDSAAEQTLISKCAVAGKAVVGVCLGAQLTGEALGAKHEHSPEPEIGNFPISMTQQGLANPKFKHFGTGLAVGHWHSDMPGLTADAKVLASSKGCPRQIIEYSPLVYGLQCHMEFSPDSIEGLIAASGEDFISKAGRPYIQSPDELRGYDYHEMNQKLFGFLDRLVEEYHSKSGSQSPAV